MKPYSVDFRQKIIEVYEQEDISIRKLAQRSFQSSQKLHSKNTQAISRNRKYSSSDSRGTSSKQTTERTIS